MNYNRKLLKVQHSPTITERQFEGQIKDLAKLFGWRYYHTWRSIHSPAGFPDVVMVRPPRLIFAELKSEKGKLSPEQEAWLEDLRECSKIITTEPIEFSHGIGFVVPLGKDIPIITIPEVYLWRPQQIDEILECLK